jgi:hypothetical protein
MRECWSRVQTGEETVFKVKRVTKMTRVFDAYAAKKGVARASIRFLFDGERINDDDSPDSVGYLHLPSALLLSCRSCGRPFGIVVVVAAVTL